MNLRNDSPVFLKRIGLTIVMFSVLFVSFGFYIYCEKQINQAHQQRYLSFKLADQLRHSSDDLTRMARTHIATSDPQYKKYYDEILDIRDGNRLAPRGYYDIYWDLVLADEQPINIENKKGISLLDMMRQAGFTESEFGKMTNAKEYSDNLTTLELGAMKLIESSDKDAITNHANATLMLHDKNYHQIKAKIMKPINEFYNLVDTRTLNNIKQKEKQALIFRIILITISLAVLFTLWRFYLSLHTTLGSSVDKIHGLMLRIGRSDFSTAIKITSSTENSVLAGLSKMQDKLYAHEVERTKADEELRIAAAFFESQEAMMITDSKMVILRVNQAFTRITGYPAEEIIGQTPRILQSGRHNKDFYSEMWKFVERTGGWQGEIWDRRKNGEIYPKWLTISVLKDKTGTVTHYIGMHTDITAHKKAEESIRKLAFFDQLTNLPNRRLLQDRLKQTMLASFRSGKYSALLFIDLDNFKKLNDTLGHDKGDMLLKQVAQRLATCIREEDTAARLGGDEFVVMLRNLSMNKENAASQTEHIGNKIIMNLNNTYQLDNTTYRNTPSIGATLFNDHLVPIEDLMKQADLAMYKSKEAGRNTLHFFDPDMEATALKRAALENDLSEAIEKKQFILHYQVQVDSKNNLMGVEALVRWQHSKRGLVSPDEFIPLAEETELIFPLGHWVLETACSQLETWAAKPEMAHLTIAVNVSAKQFHQHDFVSQVQSILKNTGANPLRLKLELTESLMVSNMEEIIQKMSILKSMGIGLALDDFGTGYSSLTYLKCMPLDWLKIDRSFVRDVLVDPNDAAIIKTIIALSKNLGLDVIAEGVETASQREFLANEGCHAYQGYLFSRPLPLEEFEKFMIRR